LGHATSIPGGPRREGGAGPYTHHT
jgi:hypothetical protein